MDKLKYCNAIAGLLHKSPQTQYHRKSNGYKREYPSSQILHGLMLLNCNLSFQLSYLEVCVYMRHCVCHCVCVRACVCVCVCYLILISLIEVICKSKSSDKVVGACA